MKRKKKKAPKIKVNPPSNQKGRSRLRQLLESYLGAVSDKTWQRCRNEYLGIANEFMYDEHELAVRGYGLKRLLCPSARIERKEAELFGAIASRFDELFYDGMTGADMLAFCQQCFRRTPEWRWFSRRGLRKQEPVTRQQALEILAAVVNSDLFCEPKPANEIPRMKRLPERVTDIFENFAA